jgi:hypothetical protein
MSFQKKMLTVKGLSEAFRKIDDCGLFSEW